MKQTKKANEGANEANKEVNIGANAEINEDKQRSKDRENTRKMSKRCPGFGHGRFPDISFVEMKGLKRKSRGVLTSPGCANMFWRRLRKKLPQRVLKECARGVQREFDF